MSKLKVDIQNSYGIGELHHEFEFPSKTPVVLVYAQNGTMKTSLAKTFHDYSIDKANPKRDVVYQDRTPLVKFSEEDNTELDPDSVYVVDTEKYSESGDSITAFLAREDLKAEYDTIYRELDDALNAFYAQVKTVSKSADCAEELREAFKSENNEETDFEIIERIEKEVLSYSGEVYRFKYNDVFDKAGKVKEFLDNHRADLQNYFNRYYTILSQSSLFRRVNGVVFGTDQAAAAIKGLGNGAFFLVGHKVILCDGREINSIDQLIKLRDDEILHAVSNPTVKQAFDAIDKAIGNNVVLRDFKAVMISHNEYLNELLDYDAFKRKVWYSFLSQCIDTLQDVVRKYREKKTALEDIYLRADNERGEWERVISLFNTRFAAPYTVDIENQRSLLLKHEVAVLKFCYHDAVNDNKQVDNSVPVKADTLLNILSRGERRAFCLLQILFQIEVRKRRELLLILDDIADSFDYRNKYAILEYINDLINENNSNVRTLILTHNFDFFRTAAFRLRIWGCNANCRFATKDPATRIISLKDGAFLNNVIHSWLNPNDRQEHPDPREFLAMLPLVRNLIEYKAKFHGDYILLTSCLHNIKHADSGSELRITRDVKVKAVLDCYKTVLDIDGIPKGSSFGPDDSWVCALEEEAKRIAAEPAQADTKLEAKIILAMVIRLKAEAYMDDLRETIPDWKPFTKHNRFGKLLDEFRKRFRRGNYGTPEDWQLLTRVSLMTAEQIHLNSFMYEPLVDMSIGSLVRLYKDVYRAWTEHTFV